MKKSKNVPRRPFQHRIETESLNQLRYQLGSDWLFRDHSERDYGTDIHLEVFDGDWATGLVLYGQVKGSDEPFVGDVKLSGFPVKTANYANLFDVPFFLFYASVRSKVTKFVWLQEYFRLNVRSDLAHTQTTLTVNFPEENVLNKNGIEKILGILKRDRIAKAGLKFLTFYERLLARRDLLRNGAISAARSCLIQLCEIQRLEFVQTSTGKRDIFACNFDAGKAILIDIIHANTSNPDKLNKFDQIIFPLGLKN